MQQFIKIYFILTCICLTAGVNLLTPSGHRQIRDVITTGIDTCKTYTWSDAYTIRQKLYFLFVWSSTCFGWHTAHHQEPKTALATSGFACVEGCWTCSCWTLRASSNYTSNNLPPYAKPEAASAVLGSWWWAVCRPKHVELHINKK